MRSFVDSEKVKNLAFDSDEGHKIRLLLQSPDITPTEKKEALEAHRKYLLRKIGAID